MSWVKVINRQDGRYVRSERKILETFKRAVRKRMYGVKMTELCRKGGYAPTTFRRHYRAVSDILLEQERVVWQDFLGWWQKFKVEYVKMADGTVCYMLFWKWLVFLLQHKRQLYVLVTANDWLVIAKMLKTLNSVTAIRKEIFDMYVGEVLVILRRWQIERYCKEKLEKHAKQLVYLAKTADWRLRELKR